MLHHEACNTFSMILYSPAALTRYILQPTAATTPNMGNIGYMSVHKHMHSRNLFNIELHVALLDILPSKTRLYMMYVYG